MKTSEPNTPDSLRTNRIGHDCGKSLAELFRSMEEDTKPELILPASSPTATTSTEPAGKSAKKAART